MRSGLVGGVASLVVVAASCTDLPNEPTTPAAPRTVSVSPVAMQGGNGKTSLELVEDDYSGGALDKQNANVYREAALSDTTQLPAKYRSSVIGKDATYSLVQMAREWSSLSKSTQQRILDLRAKGLGNLSQTFETPHFVLHYTTIGKPTTDRTSIGLVFARTPPKTELRSSALINGNLHIPAGAPDHRVDAEMTFNRDVTLWGMLPHTHVRGKRWIYEVTYPDGGKATILSVPRYDFEWQTDYIFKQPLKLPKGTTLHATAWYDNSPTNRSNPDPRQDVWWGDQTWEEMMFTGLTYSIDPVAVAGAQ